MSKLFGFIFQEISSAFLAEEITALKENKDQKKRQLDLEEKLEQILKSEQDNLYYDDLSRVLMNSHYIQDLIKGYQIVKPATNNENRINDIIAHEHIKEESRSSVLGVIKRMEACIEEIMLKPSSKAEMREAYRHKETQNMIEGLGAQIQDIKKPAETQEKYLSLSEIESYCESIKDISQTIYRKLIPHSNHKTDESCLCWIDVIDTQKRIALVNDAGVGKTYAMYQLCHDAKLNGYSVVFLSLSKNTGCPLFNILQSHCITDPQKVVLVLDGYDEIKQENLPQFTSALTSIGDRYPQLTIVLSSRSNFFAHHPLSYEIYHLADFSTQDYEEYLNERSIDTKAFFREIREHNLESLCNNAFYFVELVHLWQSEYSLPNDADVMNQIIDRRIKSDCDKYELSVPELSERTALLRRLLERIAVIMQCMQEKTVSEHEILQICNPEEYRQLRLHGVWENDDSDNWGFSHNNFREYFAACWLQKQSLKDILSFISWPGKKDTVRPSWISILAYLAKIRKSRDLQDWIAQNDPLLITMFERVRFSDEERYNIFKSIYDQHEKELTWADIDYQILKHLGSFVSCKASMEYVLDKLTTRLHMRQVKNLLRILEFFVSFYGCENDCRLVVSDIAFDDSLPDHVSIDALKVMRKFPSIFEQYTDKAAELCEFTNSEDYRTSLQYFIYTTGKIEDYFEIIVREIQQEKTRKRIYNISRELFLDKVCASIKKPEPALKLFEMAYVQPELVKKCPFDKSLDNMFDIAVNCEKSYHEKFLNSILKLLSAVQLIDDPTTYEHIRKYMIATKSENVFLDDILSYEECLIPYAISHIACPSLVSVLISYYQTDRLTNPHILERIIDLLPTNDPLQNMLIKAVFIKTGNEIQIFETVDNKTLRAKGNQIYFDALFSKSMFSQLVDGLCDLCGKDTPVREKTYIACEPLDKKVALMKCLSAIRTAISEDSKITLGTIVESISDWDKFRYIKIINAIRNHKELNVSDAQKEWITEYTYSRLSEMDFKEIERLYFAESKYKPFDYIILRVMVLLNMVIPTDLYKQLILVPSFLFGESDPSIFSQYLIEHIPETELTRIVLDNINNEDLHRDVAAAHINYCYEHKLHGAKDFAVRYLSKDEKECFRYTALKYLSELFGTNTIVDTVVPLRDDKRFLCDVSSFIPKYHSAPLLDKKLYEAYIANPAQDLLEIMIMRNYKPALEIYYVEAKKLQTPPDIAEEEWGGELTDAIKSVKNIDLLGTVIDLLQLCNQPNFRDKKTFGLRNACWESVKNIAVDHYGEVKEALTDKKDQASDDQKLLWIDLDQSIDELQRNQIDKAMSFKLALSLTENGK